MKTAYLDANQVISLVERGIGDVEVGELEQLVERHKAGLATGPVTEPRRRPPNYLTALRCVTAT